MLKDEYFGTINDHRQHNYDDEDLLNIHNPSQNITNNIQQIKPSQNSNQSHYKINKTYLFLLIMMAVLFYEIVNLSASQSNAELMDFDEQSVVSQNQHLQTGKQIAKTKQQSGEQAISAVQEGNDNKQEQGSMKQQIAMTKQNQTLNDATDQIEQKQAEISSIDEQQIINEYNLNLQQILQLYQQKLSHNWSLQQILNRKITKQRQTINKVKSKQQLNQKYKFEVPAILWTYYDEYFAGRQFLDQQKTNNLKYYCNISKFTLKILTRDNLLQYLNDQQEEQLTNILKKLQTIKDQFPQIRKAQQKIQQRIIVLYILYQFGGVYINQNYILVQDLNWLKQIKFNIHANTGNSYAKPKVFGFYSYQDSSALKQQNITAKIKVKAFMVKYPALKDYFLAALPKSKYIAHLFLFYLHFIINSNKIGDVLKQNTITTNKLDVNSIDNIFTLASSVIMQLQQRKLDAKNISKFAIDQYGLFSINSFYFPEKMNFYFDSGRFNRTFNFLSKMPQIQFEQSIGPLRYIARPDFQHNLRQKIIQALKIEGEGILEGSFLYNHLFKGGHFEFIHKNQQNTSKSTRFVKWGNLPKILWLYWDKGLKKASAVNQLSILNLKQNGLKAGFQVRFLDDKNVQNYLTNEVYDLIDDAIDNSNIPILPQTKSDLYRLGLMSIYGGVYLDSSFIFLDDFNWLIDIAGEDSSYFFNRFGTLPKVVMQFHPIYGGVFDWTVDIKANTKSQWHLAFESNFIAAQKSNQFITQWFHMLIFFIKNDYETTYQKMKECKVDGQRWTRGKQSRYLVIMDALKVVIGCRQKQLQQFKQMQGYSNAVDYYKIWGINGYTGCQKFRFQTNYAHHYSEEINNNHFLTRFSEQYVDKVLGKTYKTFKMYSSDVATLNNFLMKHLDHLQEEIHPKSLFSKYMFNSKFYEFYERQKKIHVRSIKHKS